MNSKQQILPFKNFLNANNSVNFIVGSSNFEAFSFLQNWPQKFTNINIAFLHGYPRSGKSHMLYDWAKRNNSSRLQIEDTIGADRVESRYIAIDNITTPFYDESAIFEFLNTISICNKYCLLCFNKFSYKDIVMRDLHSRFILYHELFVDDINEEIIVGVLRELFAARGRFVQDSTIKYLAPRVKRSFADIDNIVSYIHKEAITYKTNITVSFLKNIRAV